MSRPTSHHGLAKKFLLELRRRIDLSRLPASYIPIKDQSPFHSPSVPVQSPEIFPPYYHTPLQDPETDIRLLEIQPGEPADEIRVKIFHAVIPNDDSGQSTGEPRRLTLQKLNATLPEGIEACEALDGRYIFWNHDTEVDHRTSWDHPDPEFDPSLYHREQEAEPDPTYEALSYTWGHDDPKCRVLVENSMNDGPLYRQFCCRPNLIAALACLRRQSECRTFWIDAICINQNDEGEKGVQVRRIAAIFKYANRVVVWLGPEDRLCGQALRHLEYIGRQVVATRNDILLEAPNSTQRGWWYFTASIAEAEERVAIARLTSMDWFRRLWVTQEASVARMAKSIIQCGEVSISISFFWNAISAVGGNNHFRPMDVIAAKQILESICKPDDFPRLVIRGTWRPCLDPRDKVYGILAMSGRKLRQAIHPNYHAPWSPADTYRETFLAHTEITQRLELMGACSISADRNISAPSWVPDWSWNPHERTYIPPQFASGYSRAVFKASGQDTFETWGLRCGKVAQISEVLDEETVEAVIRRIGAWVREHWGDLNQKCRGEGGIRKFAETLIMGETGDYYGAAFEPTVRTIESWITFGRTIGILGAPTRPVEQDLDLATVSDEHRRTLGQVLDNCYMRRLVCTDTGHFGICPKETMAGDAIVVLLGCFSPLVLRESRTGFLVVGPCYSQGLNFAMGLLGNIPHPWVLKLDLDELGDLRMLFANTITNEITREDPRLGPLDDGWERHLEWEPDDNEPRFHDYFRRVEDGREEVINYDPRMSLKSLLERGVSLERFSLV